MALYSTTLPASLALLCVVLAFTMVAANAKQFTADINTGADGRAGSRFLLNTRGASGRHGVVRAGYSLCGTAPLYCKGVQPLATKPACCKSSSTSSITKCFDLDVNVSNCGTCGKSCPYGKVCCKGVCTNISSDSSNCGKCGHKCVGGKPCKYGICGY